MIYGISKSKKIYIIDENYCNVLGEIPVFLVNTSNIVKPLEKNRTI